jgi:hypothetical protein
MSTIPYIFRVLNALNGTDDTGVVLPTPTGAGAIVRKNAEGTVTINILGNASTADKLKTARSISLTGDAQGSVDFNGESNVSLNVSNVTGNAKTIVGRQIDTEAMADGTILVYRAFENKFIMESKGTIGAGRTLTVTNGTETLGTFSGDAETTINIGPALQEIKSQAVGGNTASATKLETARSINGTAFDGTGNITTARWGAARNVYIKDASSTNTGGAVSVDGSGSVYLLLPANIKANITGNVSGSSGSCTGNAATATKLATPRAINGTNFDGSSNIVTAQWGTARNITIKDASSTNAGTAVSVNGSAAITLLLPSTIKANITGNVSGSSGSCTGNAATATRINGKTIAYVESFNSTSGELRLRSL